MNDPVLDILQGGRARIEDPINWWGKDRRCFSGSQQKCALEAIRTVGHEMGSISDVRIAEDVLAQACLELYSTLSPVSVNDSIGHSAVMKAYDRAIKLATERANKRAKVIAREIDLATSGD